MSIVVKNACKRRKGYLYYIDPEGNLWEEKFNSDRLKKKVKKKTVKKMTKEEYKMKFLEDDLKHKEQVYETYIKALVKYNIKELAYSAIMYDELNHNTLMRNLEACRANNESLVKLMFGDGKKLNDIERVESEIEYYDKLIRRCRGMIEGARDKVKEKIAKDAVEKSLSWLTAPELAAEIIKKNDAHQKEDVA